jgi:hypothetical protein
MIQDHRKLNTVLAQGNLLDDPGFLRHIVERVLQEMLEAEMLWLSELPSGVCSRTAE